MGGCLTTTQQLQKKGDPQVRTAQGICERKPTEIMLCSKRRRILKSEPEKDWKMQGIRRMSLSRQCMQRLAFLKKVLQPFSKDDFKKKTNNNRRSSADDIYPNSQGETSKYRRNFMKGKQILGKNRRSSLSAIPYSIKEQDIILEDCSEQDQIITTKHQNISPLKTIRKEQNEGQRKFPAYMPPNDLTHVKMEVVSPRAKIRRKSQLKNRRRWRFSDLQKLLATQDINMLGMGKSQKDNTLIEQTLHSDGEVRIQLVVFQDGSTYSGYWLNGCRQGQGIFKTRIFQYQGHWHRNLMEGTGTLLIPNQLLYEGEWKEGKMDGRGTLTAYGSSKYEGDWRQGMKEGKGIEDWSDGSRYQGTYHKNYKHGKGKLTFKDGSYVIGSFSQNLIHGFAEYHWSNCKTYIGEWTENKMDGIGITTYASPPSRHEGSYKNDKYHGPGQIVYEDGSRFIGHWHFGKKHGRGTSIDKEGHQKQTVWYMGKEIDQMIRLEQDKIRENSLKLQEKERHLRKSV